LQPYLRTFPADFYQEMFRLRGMEYPNATVQRPRYFGLLTNNIVYDRLAPGVLEALSGMARIVHGLLKTLPEPDTEWASSARLKWLQTAANIFDLIYKGDGGGIALQGRVPNALRDRTITNERGRQLRRLQLSSASWRSLCSASRSHCAAIRSNVSRSCWSLASLACARQFSAVFR
jgi:hypothetical protein